MDPSNPWAYYNRLIPTGISSSATNDFQHQSLSATAAGQPVAGQASAAASILLQAAHASAGASTFNPGAFISPTPVAYESVFNPIFHHASPKPAHFNSVINSQHRQNLITENVQIKTESPIRQNYNEQQQTSAANFYTEQSNSAAVSPVANTSTSRPTNLTTWQQNSVVASNSSFANYSSKSTQQQSTPSPNNQYFRQQQQQTVSSYSDTSTQSSANAYTNTNNLTTQKERRPRKPQTTTYHPQNLSQTNLASEKPAQRSSFGISVPAAKVNNQTPTALHLVQTKSTANDAKIYPQFLIIEQEQQAKSAAAAAAAAAAAETAQAHQNANSNQEQESSSQVGYYAIVDGRLVYSTPESTANEATNANSSSGHLYLTNTGELIIAADNASAIKNETINNVASPQKQSPPVAQPSSSSNSSVGGGYSVYNSPVNSMESQQQQQQPQQGVHYTSDASGHVVIYKTNTPSRNIAPAATANQNSGSGSVAYSSVITRATGDQAKVYKTQQQQQSPHQQQSWWENEGLQGKEESFGALHNMTKNNSGQQISTENILVTTDRPLAAQVQMMQQQQQQRVEEQQVQQQIVTQEEQKPNKAPPKPKKPRKPRKTKAEKSREEILNENEFLVNRTNNSQANEIKTAEQQHVQLPQQTIQHHQQQQQNGYYDFNHRWNMQQQQQPQQNTAQIQNFNNHAHQIWPNQSIPQHSGQIPYFNPLQVPTNTLQPSHLSSIGQGTPAQQLTNHYPGILPDTNMMSSLGSATAHHNTIPTAAATSPSAVQQQQQQQSSEINENDATNKVVVPNIEEELGFLSDPNYVPPKKSEPPPIKLNVTPTITNSPSSSSTDNSAAGAKFGKPSGVGAGFMSSYLKFLQGERETSPPALGNRSGRNKASFTRITPITTNKTPTTSTSTIAASNTPAVTATGTDEQSKDDPETLKRKLNESQSSGDMCGSSNQLKPQLPKKARPQMAMQMASMQNRNQTASAVVNKNQQSTSSYHRQQFSMDDEDPLNLPPRRETSLRKAKTRGIEEIMNKSRLDNDDLDEPQEFADSDTDPVWTPEDEESDHPKFGRTTTKRKRSRFPNSRSKKSNDANMLSESEDDNVGGANNKLQQKQETNDLKTTNIKVVSESSDLQRVFRTGEFVVIRSDLVNDWPPIWQIEGAELVQKYEPFCQNGKWFYKNTSRYSSCNAETKKLFIKAPVRIFMQNITETVVEFMRSELLPGDTDQYIEKIMKDFLRYKDNFEIYLQTLLSQSLDSSFMIEITKEKDEYFLSNIRIIDELMENCKRKLLSLTPWTRNIIVSIETFPLCNVITELGQNNYTIQMVCAGCHQPGISVRFLLCGQPYNNITMQAVLPDPRMCYEKDMLLCRICAERADIFHKIAHEKHNLFETCTKRVTQEKLKEPSKSTTNILKEIMADTNWIDQLFTNLRTSWAEVESLERQRRFHQPSQ